MTLKIMITDDEDMLLNISARHMVRRGFEVAEAGSGNEALEKIQDEKPDFLLIDHKMPGFSGIETIEKVREMEEFKELPILLYTGNVSDIPDDKVAELNIKVAEKPIDFDDLKSMIEQACK
jgi:DNA-binding response OmpR family regulator